MAGHRLPLLFVVGLLHVGLGMAFVRAATPTRTLAAIESIQVHFVQDRREQSRPSAEHAVIPVMPVRVETAQPALTIAVPAVPLAAAAPGVESTAPVSPAVQPPMIESVEYMQPPEPRYPALSRRLKERGTVLLKVLVNERGDAARIEVADSSGFERLDQAAVEAVAAATFRPYLENGSARPVFVLIPIEFGLKRARG